MKKFIIGTFLIATHVNLCIGIEALTNQICNEAAASAHFITDYLHHVTKVSGATEETGGKLLEAQVELGHALFKKNPNCPDKIKQLFFALEENEAARKAVTTLDLIAQIQLNLFVYNNQKLFPENTGNIIKSLSHDFIACYFPLLMILANKTSRHYNPIIERLTTTIGDHGYTFERALGEMEISSAPISEKTRVTLSTAQEAIKRNCLTMLDVLQASGLSYERKRLLAKSFEGFYKKFQDTMNTRIAQKRDSENQTGEPAAKRQKTTEES